MAWSLLNHMVASKVDDLLKGSDKNYGPEEKRFFSREKAAAIIHAALWGYGVRADSTAGCYAFRNLIDVLGFTNWTFDQEESDALNRFRAERARRLYEGVQNVTDPHPRAEG